MRLRALGLWLILFSILAGCGRKTPPLPPEQVAPRQVSGLRYELRVSGVKLTWKVPRRTLAGTPVGHLKGFEILKTEKIIGQGLTRSFKIFVPVDRDLNKVSSFGYEDSNLRSGCRYVYRVRAVRGFRSVGPFSAPVSFSWHSPPGPPEGLRLEAWDRKIYLFWRPPQSFLDGTPVDLPLKYRLWRGLSPGALKPLAVLVDGTSFFDGSVENETRFCYRVAAVIQFYGTWIEGAPTEVLCAIPHDLTPPSAPRALVAVPVPEGIWLRWREAPEPDVAGYRVYRARKGKKFVPIHQGLIARPEYIDRTLPGPGVYVYRVTAVDDSPRANESPPSAPVEVEYKLKER